MRTELERTCGQLEAFAAVLDAGDYVEAIIHTPDPDAVPAASPQGARHRLRLARPDVRRMLVPIGPAAVFGASNFPLAFSTADRAAARPVPIPVYAEMGSVNPIVVTEAALAERGGAIAGGPDRVGGELRRPAVHQARRRAR